MYAITGASGQLGRLVIQQLIARGVPAGQIVALVRSPAKAADLAALGVVLRQADYSQPATLGPALAGVQRLLSIAEVVQRMRPLMRDEPLTSREARRLAQEVDSLARLLGFD